MRATVALPWLAENDDTYQNRAVGRAIGPGTDGVFVAFHPGRFAIASPQT